MFLLDTSRAEEVTKTMAIDNVHPAHAINRYLWSRIEAEGILSRNDYKGAGMTTGMIPIVPVKETAELITVIESQDGIGSRPYIVYTWNRINTGQMWYLKSHQIAYSVRSADQVKMGQLLNLFGKEFERYDESARKVNSYLQTAPAALKRFGFKWINLSQISGPLPSESENGEDEALVTITAAFTEPR